MKRITLAALLILAATGGMASAQYYPQYQYRPPTSYQTYGNQTYGSDGSSASTYGSQTYLNNGRGHTTVCSTYGNQTYCN